MNKKSVLITFLGNIHYDSRTANLYTTLKQEGYSVKVVSFDWLTENMETTKGEITVYKLHKGFLSLTYYLKFAILMKYQLLVTKADYIFAEDIYTLPFAVIFAKIKKAKVFYDSRELFGYLAGLKKRKFVQQLLRWIEKICISRVDQIITTGEMDSQFLEKEYNIKNTVVVRNLPLYKIIKKPFDFRKHYNLRPETKILLYQGVILHGRGLKIIYEIIKDINDCVLVVIGGGEKKNYYEELAKEKGIADKVVFVGKIDQNKLFIYTAGADIGLALIENISVSYYYALPNKMFEYILTGVPVLASNLPQMKKIIDEYEIGLYADPENLNEVSSALKKLLFDKTLLDKIKISSKKAAEELNWEKEVRKLLSIM
jgi:glycosyltransferase involved in cell wall biosynthesis